MKTHLVELHDIAALFQIYSAQRRSSLQSGCLISRSSEETMISTVGVLTVSEFTARRKSFSAIARTAWLC